MILASIDKNAADSRNFVNKSPITAIYLLPSVVTGNAPMQYAARGYQGPDFGIGSSRALW